MNSALLSQIPPLTTGRLGRPGDPVNLLFIGSGEQIRRALQEAGWTEIPGTILKSIWMGIWEVLNLKTLTLFPPMNSYRVLGKKQDMNFVRVVRPIAERHHFRLWKLPHHTEQGLEIWCGAANYDLTVRIWDLSHRPDPDIDRERDYIRKTLNKTKNISYIQLPHAALSGKNDKGYSYRTDGKTLLVEF